MTIQEKCKDIKEHYGTTNKLVQLLLRHFELEVAIRIEELKQQGAKKNEENN